MSVPPDHARRLFAINGSPIENSSVSLLLAAVETGAREAGGQVHSVHTVDLAVTPCVACGPEPTTGWCIFHDDMDEVYEGIANAHAIVVGSPVFFDGVSGTLKQVMDRCNCVTMLVRVPGGYAFRPQLARTRRAAFVTACSTRHPYEMAERSVRGFFKWVGAKWEETIAWQHEDNDTGSVAVHAPELLERARALGRRLIESPPLEA